MADDCKEFAKNILKDDDISDCEKNSKLTTFFNELTENRINYQIPCEETNDIKTCINTLVETLVALVTTKVGWLPFSRLLQVGSMAEETSIQAPDEFDYLVVLHVEDGGIEVERVCEERRGYVHVKVADPNLSLLWGKWLKGKYLKCDFTRAETDVLGRGYFDTLGNAFMIEVKEAIKEHYQELVCRAKTGTMEIDSNSMKKHGPAFMQTFIWKPSSRKKKFTINVDITPAIELNLSPQVITAEDVFDSSFFTKLQDNGKYMIISCHNNATCDARQCLSLTFTETEAELVRSLSQHHKNCYKLLKYIFSSGDGYSFLPSYFWKTLILKHNCHCKESVNLAVCFKRLVASCLHYLFNRSTHEKMELSRVARVFMPGEKFILNVPSVFFKEHNILDSKDYKIPCEIFLQEIEIMLQSVEDISRQCNPGVDSLKIVNSHAACFKGYAMSIPIPKSIPLFKENKELTRCLECYQHYFNEDIL